MRIYDFLEYYPNPYKPSIDTEIVEMLRTGHDVTVLAQGAYTTTLHDAFVQHGLQSRTRYYPTTLRQLREHGPSAVSAFLSSPVAQLERARRVTRVKRPAKQHVMNIARAWLFPVDSPDLCYVHNVVTASRTRFLRELYPKARLCMYFHGGEVGGHKRTQDEAEIYGLMDAVVSNTRCSAAQVIERGCPAEKVAVIPVGFRIEDYSPSPHRTYRPQGKLRIASIGRMSPEKGILYAFRALQQLLSEGFRDFHYRLIGVGTQLTELQNYVRANGLSDYITFAGEKKKSEVIAELDNTDVLLLPSSVTDTWAETQAAVVQEAALMKCPALTTIAGGVPESTPPELHRFSVPPNNAEAIAQKLREISELSAEEMTHLGERARAFGLTYDIAPLMQRILAHALGQLPKDDPGWVVPRG